MLFFYKCEKYEYLVAGWGRAVNFTDDSKASKLSTFISRTPYGNPYYPSYHEDELIQEKYDDYRKWIDELTQNASTPSNLKQLKMRLSLDCYEWNEGLVYENEAEREKHNSHHICVQSFLPIEQGVCNGDSGGPLVMIDMVTNEVGVVGIVESRNYCTLSPGKDYF